jgi:FkbM family methyltransferase
MRELLKRLGGHSALGAVLHVGAGACTELEDFQRLKAEKILLVEANPELAERLQRRGRGDRRIQVVSSAVAAQEADNAILRVLNNPRESSLLKPARLLERLPNLRVAREVQVPVVTLARMVRRLAPDPARPNLLLIEAPGVESSLLASITAEELHRFYWIAVRASVEPLYEGGACLEEVDAALAGAGFRLAMPAPADSALPFQDVLYGLDAQLAYSLALAHLRAAEVAEARQDAARSRQLQAVREADLKELQERYRASLAMQEQHHDTLSRVAERLRAASAYFHEMLGSPPEAPGAADKTKSGR